MIHELQIFYYCLGLGEGMGAELKKPNHQITPHVIQTMNADA